MAVFADWGEGYAVDPELLPPAPDDRRDGHAPPVSEQISEGERNGTLTSLAGTMRRRGMAEAEIAAALLAVNAARCRPPLPEDEVRGIAASVARYEPEPSVGRIVFGEDGHRGQSRGTRQKRDFVLTRLDGLLAEPPEAFEYLVEGLMIAGGVSLIAAKPKVGKSTTIRNAAYAVASGRDFLGRATRQGPVVYLALEEKRSQVRQHFARMGAADEPIFVHVGAAPEAALDALDAAIREHGAVLAIGDPAFKLIRLKDGNDYAEVTRALEPVIELARSTSCHIALVHHMGKGERAGGDAILGSTALFGAVDAALLMRRRDQVRTIESIQRYGEDLPETVVALDPDTGLVRLGGDLAGLRLGEAGRAILDAIGDLRLEEADIRERVGGNQSLCGKALRNLVEDGALIRSGEGKRGNPYLYGRPGPALAASADSLLSRFSPIGNRENQETEKRVRSENGASLPCALCLGRPADSGDLCRACEDRLDARIEGAAT